MPIPLIQSLIDKQDNFEIIRDEIAAILAAESANQMQLAADAAKDPTLWKLRVYTEVGNPLSQYQEKPDDTSPVINVWYQASDYSEGNGDVVKRQQPISRYNIDCYGFGVSQDIDGGGHIPGDEAAAKEAQRAIRLVRNILMSANYTYLGNALRGIVGRRWVRSVNAFQLEPDNASKVYAIRMAFEVFHNEESPQITGETLELIAAEVLRKEDGELYFEAHYPKPAP